MVQCICGQMILPPQPFHILRGEDGYDRCSLVRMHFATQVLVVQVRVEARIGISCRIITHSLSQKAFCDTTNMKRQTANTQGTRVLWLSPVLHAACSFRAFLLSPRLSVHWRRPQWPMHWPLSPPLSPPLSWRNRR